VEVKSTLFRKGRGIFKVKNLSNSDFYDAALPKNQSKSNFDKMVIPTKKLIKNSQIMTTEVAPMFSSLPSTRPTSST
jgi:hypothetical protein